MKKKIIELYYEKSDRNPYLSWGQIIAVDEDGKEYGIQGSYCGGVPESHWTELKAVSEQSSSSAQTN